MGEAAGVAARAHESVQRRLLARAYGESYEALPTLEAAREVGDAVVILEAGAGEQIYLVCPVTEVHCSVEVLQRLLAALDQVAWCGGDLTRAGIFYERHPLGARIYGGAGGGRVVDGVWVHTQFDRIGLRPAVCEVLAGTPWHPREPLTSR